MQRYPAIYNSYYFCSHTWACVSVGVPNVVTALVICVRKRHRYHDLSISITIPLYISCVSATDDGEMHHATTCFICNSTIKVAQYHKCIDCTLIIIIH